MTARGLSPPVLVIADSHPGLRKAVKQVFEAPDHGMALQRGKRLLARYRDREPDPAPLQAAEPGLR